MPPSQSRLMFYEAKFHKVTVFTKKHQPIEKKAYAAEIYKRVGNKRLKLLPEWCALVGKSFGWQVHTASHQSHPQFKTTSLLALMEELARREINSTLILLSKSI